MRKSLVAVGAMAALAAGCSKGSSSATNAGAANSAQPKATVTITETESAGSPSTTPTASPGPVTNLVLTQTVRQSLIAARAAQIGVPPSGFTTLVHGTAYYAKDNTTGTYWAGASLIPSQSSEQAEVSSQDDGGYLVFEMTSASGKWKVFSTGLAGSPEGSGCPVTIPPAVLALWHWKPASCAPPAF